MTEILIYQLQRQPLERVLPALIEKSLERGWRVIIQAASEERLEALDAQLWTFRDDSFLPHGTWREAEAGHCSYCSCARQSDYQRIVLLVDGEDPDAVAAALAQQNEGRAKGFEVTYWRPDEEGRWRRLG